MLIKIQWDRDLKHCFAVGQGLGQFIKITAKSGSFYLSSVQGYNSNVIQINPDFARKQGIQNNEWVLIESVRLQHIQQAEVIPLDQQSWEVIEQSALYLEENFLRNISVLQQGLIIPLYIGIQPVFVKVGQMDKSPAFVNQNSQILVKPIESAQSIDSHYRCIKGGIYVMCNDFPENSLVFISNSTFKGAGIVCAGEIREKWFSTQWAQSFQSYQLKQVAAPPSNKAFVIENSTGRTFGRNFKFALQVYAKDVDLRQVINPEMLLFDGMIYETNGIKVKVQCLSDSLNRDKFLACIFLQNSKQGYYEQINAFDLIRLKPKTKVMERLFWPEQYMDLSQDISSQINQFFEQGTPDQSIVIQGDVGTGKSAFIDLLISNFETSYIASEYLDCNLLQKPVDQMQLIYKRAYEKSPCVIILDSLDAIATQNEDNPQIPAQHILQSLQVTNLICEFMLLSQQYRKTFVIASCRSYQALHPLLLRPNFLTSKKQIPSLNFLNRQQIISNLFPNANTFDEIIEKTKSFRLKDFQQLYQISINHDQDEIGQLIDEYFNLKTKTNNQKSWEDIFGLEQVKEQLIEAIQMPIKFQLLFQNFPLKLRSGVLLYGPPGCGKTLIAQTLPQICQIPIVSVKGPELLNKYIGASEQQVRDVFQSARRQSPCILFFDEFEAIAVKRGNEKTGVGDRMVNQLLVELDGVESRGQVFVVGASSRPEMIDPALLRPGRLDLHLLCDFPTYEDQLLILESGLIKFGLTFGSVSRELLVGFSPADINNVVNDIRIMLAKDPLLQFSDQLLHDIIRDTRPSFSLTQIQQLRRKFERFRKGETEVGSKTLQA